MAQIETLGILQDLESLVSDQLQVVSYKWLSRNYLVSSNAAKRLLQEFVEKHGKGLEVVYSLSGWLKSNPPSYHIRLVSGPKLAEAREELGEGCSVQVYSVQACIPKDPAALWNIEFVQAEELCKQPSTVDNCLRDNRFCGISNSFVKRNVEGTSTSVSAPQLQSGVGSGPSKSNLSRQNDMVPQSIENKGQQSFSKAGQPSPDMVKDVKSENNGARVHDQDNKPSTDKEKVPSVAANKKKVQNSKSSSGTEGSLANFWSRASAKSKASFPSENNDLVSNSTGASAEAQISAQESVNVDGVNSDDDGPEMNFKRGSNGDGARKRRVVFDFSDEDEYEDAVNLASPDRGQSCKDQKQTIKSLVPEKPNLNLDTEVEDKLDVKEKVAINRGCNQVVKEDSSALVNDGNIGIPVKGKTNNCDPKNDANKTNKHVKSSPESPKRRKVMKTHIDERGREVREVVWEGEETEAKKANSGTIKQDDSGATKKGINNTVANTVNRPQAPKKSPAVGNTALSGKAGNKKNGSKDPKQGNILSFFKKV
ncbi:hypothetical protein UlMin_028078 [Ulmus minor]